MRTCFVTRHDRAKALHSASQSETGGVEAPTSPADVKYPLTGTEAGTLFM